MRKRNVTYVKPEEPTFLRQLKETSGYKEGPTIDTKRELLPTVSHDDFADRDDEKPVVVVVTPGDITAEEAASIVSRHSKKIEEKLDFSTPEERILFRKPTKRGEVSQSEGRKATEKKRRKSEELEEKRKKQRAIKQVKNTNLLSFDGDSGDS